MYIYQSIQWIHCTISFVVPCSSEYLTIHRRTVEELKRRSTTRKYSEQTYEKGEYKC